MATRRSFLATLTSRCAMGAALLSRTSWANGGAGSMPVVRLSRGSFAGGDYPRVRARLEQSQASLVPAIRRLKGCLHYWAGIDAASNTIVNVSIWESPADARQMETLAPMLALAGEFTAIGVTFERPVINYESVWQI